MKTPIKIIKQYGIILLLNDKTLLVQTYPFQCKRFPMRRKKWFFLHNTLICYS